LTISYTDDGEIKTYVVAEHESISLPQKKSPTDEKPKKVVNPEQSKNVAEPL